jgi:uncharacterized protein (TIRG00374 family)
MNMKNKSKYLKYGLHIAILIGLTWAVMKYVNGQKVLNALQTFNYIFMPFMVILALSYLLIKAARFVILMNPFTEKLTNRIIYKGYISGQPATLLPGGIAARAGLMNQVGVPLEQTSVPIAVHSGWDQIVFLLGGLIAALWFPSARLPVLIILGVLIITGALLLIPTTRNWLAGMAERITKRFIIEKEWNRFLDAIPQVFTKKIIILCFFFTVVAFAMQIIILGLTMQGLKLDVPVPTLFLAFIVPTMLGRLVPIPGGIGVTEAGMVGFLTATAQLNTGITVAAVAIFRIVSIVIPAAIGALVYFFIWKGNDEVNGSEEQSPSNALYDFSCPSSSRTWSHPPPVTYPTKILETKGKK